MIQRYYARSRVLPVCLTRFVWVVEDACDCPAEQEKGDSDAAEAY